MWNKIIIGLLVLNNLVVLADDINTHGKLKEVKQGICPIERSEKQHVKTPPLGKRDKLFIQANTTQVNWREIKFSEYLPPVTVKGK